MAAAGCGVEDPLRQPALPNDPPVEIEPGVFDGQITGDIGEQFDIDTPVHELHMWNDGDYAAVEGASQLNDEHAVMMFLSFTDPDLLRAGTTAHMLFGDLENGLSILGCTGQGIGIYDTYDAPADIVDLITVDGELEGQVFVSVTGTWFIERPGQETLFQEAMITFTLQQ